LNLTYKLPKNFTVQVNSNNDSRFPSLQGYRGAIRAADFAIRKSFWENKASVVFTINDIFNSRRSFNYYDQLTVINQITCAGILTKSHDLETSVI
jgi:hypothetical protein